MFAAAVRVGLAPEVIGKDRRLEVLSLVVVVIQAFLWKKRLLLFESDLAYVAITGDRKTDDLERDLESILIGRND